MKTIKVDQTTVHADGQDVKEQVDFMLMPPHEAYCQTCGRDHKPDEPHDRQALYYQYAFFAEHGRWPSWADAMAHCAPVIQAAWRHELTLRGVDVDG